MNLHEDKATFADLASFTAEWRKIPLRAVVKDYFIVTLLSNLQESSFGQDTLFKGGTSLSKCYDAIHRFSEDIDLTYLPSTPLGSSAGKKAMVNLVSAVAAGFRSKNITKGSKNITEKVYFDSGFFAENPDDDGIKLEVGSIVNYGRTEIMEAKSYIHEFLEAKGLSDAAEKYNLRPVRLSVLPIEITFLEKLSAIKTHAHRGTLSAQARHIFDVSQLFKHPRIQSLLCDPNLYYSLRDKVAEQSAAYYEKRKIDLAYDLSAPFSFKDWKHLLNEDVQRGYQEVLSNLVYGGEEVSFSEATNTLSLIDKKLETLKMPLDKTISRANNNRDDNGQTGTDPLPTKDPER